MAKKRRDLFKEVGEGFDALKKDRPKKVKKVERELYNVRVLDDSYHEVTREAEPGEQWDGDDTYTSHNIKGIELVGKSGYGDVMLGYKPEMGGTYYLLYVIYSTADSFHCDEGCINFVDLYRTMEEAKENAKLLEKHYRLYEEGHFDRNKDWNARYSVQLKNHGGTEFTYHCPFVGYFERLSSIEVESVSLKSSLKIRM